MMIKKIKEYFRRRLNPPQCQHCKEVIGMKYAGGQYHCHICGRVTNLKGEPIRGCRWSIG